MFQYLFRRLLVAIPTLFVIITLAFFMVRAAPGGPFDQDRKIPPEIEANLNRVYHLDEPLYQQYFRYMGNVLRGDLSLVGPRPILPQEVKFSQSRTALLHSVKSGVTGLWQVSGRSDLSFDERIELELYYAQNWSFWLDLRILFKTIAVVMRKTGAR